MIHTSYALAINPPLNSTGPERRSNDEKGGEIALQGFRYQAAYTAKLALELFNPSPEYSIIYCEQLNDILVKNKDNFFQSIQVKCRNPRRHPFTTSDKEIWDSLLKFIKIEEEYGNSFVKYVIVASNFYEERDNSNNLSSFLDYFKSDVTIIEENEYIEKYKTLIRDTNVKKEIVLNTLKKCFSQVGYDYNNYEKLLAYDIGVQTQNDDMGLFYLVKISQEVISKIMEASNLLCDYPRREYLNLLNKPSNIIDDEIIKKKRITKEIIQQIIDKYKIYNLHLSSIDKIDITKLPLGYKILEYKMLMGGLTSRSITNSKDQKLSFEELLLNTYYKVTPRKAENILDELSVIVNTECNESYERFKTGDLPFGQKMYNDVCHTLRNVHTDVIKPNYKEITYYHLLGVIGTLTEKCDVWWSEKQSIVQGE